MIKKISRLVCEELPAFSIIILSIITYIYFSWVSNKNFLEPTSLSYYNSLISAFFQKRFDLYPAYDLSLFNDRWYAYWGPAPVLVILPFYLFFKQNPSDIFYTLAIGILNIIVFYLVLKLVEKYFSWHLGSSIRSILLLNFSLASPNLYLSLAGRIWHTNQVISIFYLLLFLYFYFSFLNKQRIVILLLATIFFNLSWFSRLTLIFYGILFVYLLFVLYQNKSLGLAKKSFFIFAITSFFFIIIFFWYNWKRFGNPLETGYRYQVGAERFNTYFRKGKIFSLNNIRHNFSIYFLNHLPISLEDPLVRLDPEGNSVFSVYPILILLPLIPHVYGRILKQRKALLFMILSLVIVGLDIILLLLNIGTGWIQFGCRYFYDVIPLLFLLLLPIVKNLPRLLIMLLTIYGSLINVLGTLTFYGLIK